jgi:hypothetical protein
MMKLQNFRGSKKGVASLYAVVDNLVRGDYTKFRAYYSV